MKQTNSLRKRLLSAFLALVCVLGLLPAAAFAATPDTIKMDDCTHNGVKYESPALGTCHLHQMHFGLNGKSTMGFCAEKGKGMGWSLEGQTWGKPKAISDPTVSTMMAYFYAHSTGVFTDQAKALGVDDVWSSDYTWTMNAWVQAVVWRYKAGLLSDPVTACAEELMCVYNNLEHTNYSSIDDVMDGRSFHDRAQYILDLGAQGVWGECAVYEYAYTGSSTSYHPANDVQAIMIGELNVTRELYSLVIKKVDSTNPNKTLPGARFKVASENGSYVKEVVTGGDGTVTVPQLEAGTYAVTELEAPEGYEIDNAGPQYVVLPNGTNKTVTITFSDTPEITGEGSIRKVDADDPTKGLAGAVIKITGVDNDFVGTYVTGEGGYLTDVPWKDMPLGSYTAEEVTPPEGYTTSPDVSKTKQTFVWDGKTDVALVFENDARVKVQLIKKDDSDNPLPGAVFNIIKDGQIIGTEATKADGSITVTDVTEGMYAFVEVSAPAPYSCLTEPVIAHVDQATINGGGTVTVTASDKKLPSLTILKRDAQTKEVIPGTVFEIKGIHYHYHDDVTTGPDGRAVLINIPVDSYEVTEKSVPDPYVVGEEPTQTIYLGPGENRELIFDNLKQPVLKISKVEEGTNTPIPGTVFTVEGIDSDYRHDVTTEADGTVELRVAPGSYRVTEKSVPAPYCLPEDEADRTQTISLNGGDEKTLIFKNSKKPLLTLSKIDADTGVPVPGTVLTVEGIDSDYKDDWRTGPDGTVALRVDPGAYRITEKSVPAPYYLPDKDADRVQTISLNPGDEKTVVFRNHKTPELTIFKEDSVAGAPVEGAKFRVTYTSNGEATGAPAYMDFGIFVTDTNGQIKLHEKGKKLYPGEYTVTEVEPAPGYQMKEPTTQKVILHGGESKTLTFFNEPLNTIVVEKYDSVTHEALPGCTFQLRFLGGTSGTGGTVIGTKVTGKNGTAIWTGLTQGTYIVEEISPADGYSIINSSETVYISDKGEQNVITVSFDNAPDGTLLIRKVCSVNPSVTLQDAEFKVMYADGTLIGDSNGIYRTDENGEIRIEGLKPGKSVVVTETRAPAGFIIDTQSQTIQIQAGKTVSLTFKNQPKGQLIIQKRDSVTGQPLPGAEFRVTTAAGCEVGLDGVIGSSTLTQNGLFTTDSNGEIRITNLAPGAYVLTETKAPDGYIMDAPSTNVVIGANGDTQTVVVTNTPKGGLLVKKMDSATKEPLADVIFKITRTDGTVVGNSNGEYRTDERGFISLPGLEPGSYIVREVQAKSGYLLDDTPHAVEIKDHQTYTLEVFNQPLGNLIINKLSSVDNTPLEGVKFQIKYANGQVVDNKNGQMSSNGIYYTDRNGQIILSGVTGSIVVTELESIPGYRIDPNTKTQTLVVNPNDTQTINFYNTPTTTLIIRKFVEGTENEPLSGVCFKVVDGSGAAVGPDDGLYYTDKSGEIVLTGIEPGTTVIAREVKTVEGYVLDGTPQDIKIEAGHVQQLTFWNKRAGTLVIQKKDSVSGALISGAQFQLTYANGGYVDNDNGHLSSNGLYTTDDKGEIRISGITGTVVAKEVTPAPGYVIDQSTQTQTVTVNPLDTQTLTFLNEPLCSLTLTKLDSATGKPIPGTEFTVKDGNSTVLGRYTTGKDGTVVVTGLVPGSTVVVTETKVPSGYVLDPTPQTIIVKNGSNTVSSGTTNVTPGGSANVGGGTNGGNDLVFENDPIGTFELIKVVEGNKEKRIPNVTFEIRRVSDDALMETVTTGSDGRVSLKLDAGNYYALETEAAKGYKLDATRHYFTMENGKNTTLTVENKPFSGILIHKTDSVTGKGIQGVTFLLYDSTNTPVGQYTSDNSGYVYIENLTVSGRYYLRELENEGYVPDTQMKTVYVTAGETTLIEWKNIPITAQIQILKKSADYNSTNGLPAGTLLEGAVFEIYDKAGNLVDTIKSDNRGLASSKPLPLGRYTIRETKAPANYGVSDQELTAYLEHEGQILRFEVTNKSLTTGVSITKTGPKEAMAGQPVNYVLSGIANNSNVRLDNFYWRDTLPAQARLNTIVTGTYNFPGVYKITYRVNGGEYRTLADNLSTSKNYNLQASPAALGLAANERVTEVMFVFGQAPAGFAQVEKPQIKCTAVAGLKAGSSFVNIADVGGTYNGVWVQAISRWVTTVYGKPTPLPKTGY